MNKPPENIDLNNYTHLDSYDTIRNWGIKNDHSRIVVIPKKLNVFGLALMCLLIFSFFYGIDYLVKSGSEEYRSSNMRILVLGMGVATCTLVAGLISYRYLSQRKKGDYLVIDILKRKVELPRLGKIFEFPDVKYFQVICTRNPNWTYYGQKHEHGNSEFNIIVLENEMQIRYNLLSLLGSYKFKKLIREIVKSTSLPIKIFREKGRSWEVEITDYYG
jgi:hypothetical protein